MFPNLNLSFISIKFEPERGCVAHVDVDVHVAYVVVVDQVHVTKLFNSTKTWW